jgi:hypothetical protein
MKTGDKTSTSNLKSHTIWCFGKEEAATGVRNLKASHEVMKDKLICSTVDQSPPHSTMQKKLQHNIDHSSTYLHLLQCLGMSGLYLWKHVEK